MDPRAAHVRVKDVQVWGDVLAPGLLLGWRKRKGVWEGWVVVAQLGPQDYEEIWADRTDTSLTEAHRFRPQN